MNFPDSATGPIFRRPTDPGSPVMPGSAPGTSRYEKNRIC